MGLNQLDAILLVDDDPITCYLNSKVIAELGYTGPIAEVCSGKAALDYLKKTRSLEVTKTRSTLILLDINMPDMNGFEFLQELALLEAINRDKLFVAILSSSSNSKDLEEASKHMLVGYLEKPLNEQQFQTLIRKLSFSS